MLTCSRCGVVTYCSRTCQQAHYAVHKPECAFFEAPDDVDKLYNIGVMMLNRGGGKATLRVFEKVLKIQPNHYMSLVNIGCIAAQQVRHVEDEDKRIARLKVAEKYFRRACESNPNGLTAMTNLTYNLIHQGLFDVVAEENLVARAIGAPGGMTDYFAHYLKGIFDANNMNYADSLAAFLAAERLNPKDEDVQFEMGLTHEEMRKDNWKELATACFKKAGQRGLEELLRIGVDLSDDETLWSLDSASIFQLARDKMVNSDTIVRHDPMGNPSTEAFFVEKDVCAEALKLIKIAAKRPGGRSNATIREFKHHVEIRLGMLPDEVNANQLLSVLAQRGESAFKQGYPRIGSKVFTEAIESLDSETPISVVEYIVASFIQKATPWLDDNKESENSKEYRAIRDMLTNACIKVADIYSGGVKERPETGFVKRELTKDQLDRSSSLLLHAVRLLGESGYKCRFLLQKVVEEIHPEDGAAHATLGFNYFYEGSISNCINHDLLKKAIEHFKLAMTWGVSEAEIMPKIHACEKAMKS